ncbi:hypothetical protein ACROYT_G029786 [Oculina patagonica]
MSSKKDGKGTCELNKHDISLINENTNFHDEQDVIFSILLKVQGKHTLPTESRIYDHSCVLSHDQPWSMRGRWMDAGHEDQWCTGGKTGFDKQETKLLTYWNTPFTRICLGMKIGQQNRFIAINMTANSLYSLIADGKYRATSLGRDTWKTLIGSEAFLQAKCSKEGFSAVTNKTGVWPKARIGILGNNENDCISCDSRIGFGTAGKEIDMNTCRNEASKYYGNKHIKAMGYILKITKTRKPNTSAEPVAEFKSTAVLPYVKGLSEQPRRCLQQQGVRAVFKSETTLRSQLVRPKDAVDSTKQDGVVYRIPCECGKVYIGETGRPMQDRIKEHDRDIRLARTQTSAVAEHTNNTGHYPLWNEVKFIDRNSHWYTRRVKEAIHIRLHPNNINRDSGIEIPEAWMPTIKKHNNRRTVRLRTAGGATVHQHAEH